MSSQDVNRVGFGPGCHSNCGWSSQTLGNPPVTLTDLSPPKPEDNGSAGSGGPGCLSAWPPAALCRPPPRLEQPSQAQDRLSWARAVKPGPKAFGGPPPPTLIPVLIAPHQSPRDICAVPGETCPPPTHTGDILSRRNQIRIKCKANLQRKKPSEGKWEEGAMRKETSLGEGRG